MIRRPPRSTRTDHSFPTLRSSDPRSRHIAIRRRIEPSRSTRQKKLFAERNIRLPPRLRKPITRPNSREVTYSWWPRSEEHTSELQSLMRISYAVFCLKKKKQENTHTNSTLITTSFYILLSI